MKEVVIPGREYIVFGKASRFNRTLNMLHPDLDVLTNQAMSSAGMLAGIISGYRKI